MQRMLIPALGAFLLVAGCDGGSSAQNVTTIKTANTYSDQLAAMTPLYRNLGLWRAIRDAPERCKKVDNGAFQETYKDMAMWTAHCTDTGEWMLFIAPSGDVQVRACTDAASLKLPACRPLPEVAATEPPKAAKPKGG